MMVYINEFPLLKRGYAAFLDQYTHESVILPSESSRYLSAFMEVRSYWSQRYNIDYTWRVTDYRELMIEGMVVVEGIASAWVSYNLPWNGYDIILFDVAGIRHALLVVMRRIDHSLVGTISSRYGGMSSSELSRLIMTLPELDWNV